MADRDLRINIEAKTTGKGDLVQIRQEINRVETGIDELRNAIKTASNAFEEARAKSISLKTAYINLRDSGEGTKEEFRALSKQIEKAQAVELEAIQITRRLIGAIDEMGDETGETAAEFLGLDKRLAESEGKITGVTAEVRTMGTGFNRLSGDINEVGGKIDALGDDSRRAADGIDKLGDETKRVGNSVDKLGDDSRRAADGVEKLGNDSRRSADGIEHLNKNAVSFSAVGNIIADAVQDAARAVVQFAQDSTQAFYDFDRSSREVFTLIPGASAEMRDALQKDALALGTELGRLPDEVLPAIYDALSAGVPADNVLETVKTASDAARAGVAELDTTLQLGLGILNAQVGGVDNLSDVYDQLFFIVKNGVITLPQLNDVMSQVTSVAGEAGVSMQDISAAMIVMTRQGDTAAEAAELLSIMLTQLSTSGTTLASTFEQAAGKSFRQFIAEGGNLAGAMEILQNHANDTGQALGDILGGGSPFFRDTQAARGALELTGKHLESLIHFADEAEEATGSMAVAASEMGEAAEMGALQGKAAYEEFKIAIGEAAAEMAGPLLANATEFLKVWSGNRANEVGGITDELIQQAESAEDLVEAGQRIGTAYDTATRSVSGMVLAGGQVRDELTEGSAQIVQRLAEQSASLEEFRQKLVETGVVGAEGTFALFNGFQFNPEEAFGAAQLDRVNQSLGAVDEKMARLTYTRQAAGGAADEYAYTLEELARMGREEAQAQYESAAITIEASRARIEADEQIAAVAEDRAARIAAAAAAEQAAILASREAYNGYALTILNGGEAETNWTDALFQTAGQMGINQGQFRELAEASGEYSEAQIRAALTDAAMRQAVEELSGKLAAGTITVGEAIQSMNDFKDALANDYTATLEYGDFVNAEAQARATRDALLAAEGDYSANFTTTNTTVNQTVNLPPVGGPTGTGAPTPNYSGGRFAAGQYLIVGDGPGGQILPTTELVVFDQPGRVFSGRETASILGQAGPGEPDGLASPAGNGGAAAAPEAARPINVYLTLPNVRDGRQFVGELDQALKALQRAGIAN
jgi:TP901 family phage tail tape measure protein